MTGRGSGVARPSPTPESIEEYIRSIPCDKQNVVVSTPQQIAAIADEIAEWQCIAPHLELTHPDMERIRRDHSLSYDEQKLVAGLSLMISLSSPLCCIDTIVSVLYLKTTDM